MDAVLVELQSGSLNDRIREGLVDDNLPVDQSLQHPRCVPPLADDVCGADESGIGGVLDVDGFKGLLKGSQGALLEFGFGEGAADDDGVPLDASRTSESETSRTYGNPIRPGTTYRNRLLHSPSLIVLSSSTRVNCSPLMDLALTKVPSFVFRSSRVTVDRLRGSA